MCTKRILNGLLERTICIPLIISLIIMDGRFSNARNHLINNWTNLVYVDETTNSCKKIDRKVVRIFRVLFAYIVSKFVIGAHMTSY